MADITSISGVFGAQTVTIDVTFVEQPRFDNAWDFQLFIDSDDDERTGYGAGYERLIRDVGMVGLNAALYDAEPGPGPNGWGPFIEGISVAMVSSRHLRLQILLASNGVPTGFFRYAFETYVDGALVDAVYDRRTTSTTGQDCNQNGIDDERDIELGESDDCNSNMIPDECEPDCDRDGVPDACAIIGCQPWQAYCKDCNGNGAPDACDLIDGISDDCDLDGIPDECTVATADCNSNSIPDTCDLSDGVSTDFNENLVPDDCEAVAGGSRYLVVTPFEESLPVALLISGNPFDPDVSCLSQYVQSDGTLGT